jgi:hypothetical protein
MPAQLLIRKDLNKYKKQQRASASDLSYFLPRPLYEFE